MGEKGGGRQRGCVRFKPSMTGQRRGGGVGCHTTSGEGGTGTRSAFELCDRDGRGWRDMRAFVRGAVRMG
jgi:hypothetical protein